MRALVLMSVGVLTACETMAQTEQQSATESFLREFTTALGDKRGDPGAFQRLAHERIWATYEWPAERKQELFAYLRNGPDGPGKGFAALITVGFRDPEGASALLDAAADPKSSAATRYYCLNAAPCVLGMGDVWTMQEQTPEREAQYIESLRRVAKAAKETSIGRAHAATITELQAAAAKAKANSEDGGDYGLALWHISAYQLGSLDLASYEELEPFLKEPGPVSTNVVHALGLATNQDFFAPVRQVKAGPDQDAAAKQALESARQWWLANKAEADRPLRQRLAESFVKQGIDPKDPASAESLQALKELIKSEELVAKFNAYRLVNELAGTHFDLDFVFLLDKYALHPIVSGLKAEAQEEELHKRVAARIDQMVAAARK